MSAVEKQYIAVELVRIYTESSLSWAQLAGDYGFDKATLYNVANARARLCVAREVGRHFGIVYDNRRVWYRPCLPVRFRGRFTNAEIVQILDEVGGGCDGAGSAGDTRLGAGGVASG